MLVSAKTGQRTDKLLKAVLDASRQYSRWINTRIINDIIEDAVMYQAPPKHGLKGGKIYYTVQASISPPTFVLFCNDVKCFPSSYEQYLDRKIREALGFQGTPLKLLFREKGQRRLELDMKQRARKTSRMGFN